MNEFGSNALCSVSKQVELFEGSYYQIASGGRGGRSNVNNSLTYRISNNKSSLGQRSTLRAFLKQKTIFNGREKQHFAVFGISAPKEAS